MNKKAHFSISMDPILLQEIEDTRGLAKRSTFIEWQVSKAFKLDMMRDSLEEICDDLLNKILVLQRIPKEVRSIRNVQMMIDDARERVEKMKKLIEKTE